MTQLKKLYFLILVAGFFTLSMSAHATEVRHEYYVGMQTLESAVEPFSSLVSPKAKLVVQLTFDRDNGTITETVHRQPVGGDPEPFYVNTMTQIGNSSSFSALSPSFTGTVTYAGEDWNWDSWTYNLLSSDPSLPLPITGTGEYTDYGIHLNQNLVNPFTQEVLVAFDTHLVHIDQNAYEALVRVMEK